MTRTQTIDDISGANVFDIRDVMARFEELEAEREALIDAADEASQEPTTQSIASASETEAKEALDAWTEGEEGEEFRKLSLLLDEVRGEGGDEQWRGDWYPVSFIRDKYFTDYAEELVNDIGELPREIPHYIVIDWEATAHNIRQDYSSVEFDGNTYWYR